MLTIDELVVRYGAIDAVAGVSLEISQGQVVVILGANGAGKSSVMNCIAGLIRPASGRIAFHGKPIHGCLAHQIVRLGISLVPEGRRIFPAFTVAENIRLAARSARRGSQYTSDTVLELFPALQTRLEQRAGTLSGGEQQMLAVARAMVTQPELLLLDEPSMGLAPSIAQRLFEKLDAIRELGTTMLIVEQDVHHALAIADVAYVLRNGSIAAAGLPEELSQRADLAELYLGTD